MTKINNVKLPSHIKINYKDEDLFITSRWFTWPRLVFSLVGIGIYLSLAVRISSTAESDIISLVVFLTGGFFILIGMVCFFIGRTFLILNKDTIIRESFPLPFGNKKFYTHKVKRFYAKENITTRKGNREDEFANKMEKDSKTVSYEMVFLLHSGEEIPVLKLHEKEQAKYIEQEVENHLKLDQAQEELG